MVNTKKVAAIRVELMTKDKVNRDVVLVVGVE